MVILGVCLAFLSMIFAQVFGVYGSKKWIWVALLPGFLGGFLIGYSTQIFSLSPGSSSGVLIGSFVDIFIVGGGRLTRFYRDSAKRRLHKLRKN